MTDVTLFDRAGEILAVVRADVGDDPGTWEIHPGSRDGARVLHELAQENEPIWLEIEDIRIRGSLTMEPHDDSPRWYVRHRRPVLPLRKQDGVNAAAL